VMSLAELAIAEGDFDAAVPMLTEAHRLGCEIGHRELEAGALAELSVVGIMEGRLDDAAFTLREALAAYAELGFNFWGLLSLAGSASLALLRGDAKRSAQLWGAFEALADAAGLASSFGPETQVVIDAFLPATRSELGEAAFVLQAAAGARLTFEEAVALALEGATRGQHSPPSSAETEPGSTLRKT
jgi:hypothetical protein